MGTLFEEILLCYRDGLGTALHSRLAKQRKFSIPVTEILIAKSLTSLPHLIYNDVVNFTKERSWNE